MLLIYMRMPDILQRRESLFSNNGISYGSSREAPFFQRKRKLKKKYKKKNYKKIIIKR